MQPILKFNDFLNENEQISLSFKVDDFGIVNIFGKKFPIMELLSKYGYLQYAYGIYFDKQVMYFPDKKKFKIVKSKNSDEIGKILDIPADKVKWKTVKITPDYITGIDLERILYNSHDAADYKMHKHYIEILDWEQKVIAVYQVDQKTGKLS